MSLSCQSDSDCGHGTRCYLDMGTRCVTAADGGSSCSPGSVCVPQRKAPCFVDADCGAGFTCSNGPKSWNCGADQDASQPPYTKSMIVPCSDVPTPGSIPGFDGSLPFAVPAICKPGSSCLFVTWKVCVARQTPTCAVDFGLPLDVDLPVSGDVRRVGRAGASPGAGQGTVDAACTKACVAPNSDLSTEVCNGSAAGPVNGGGVAPPPSLPARAVDSGPAGSSASPGAAGSAGSGGCQVGMEETTTGWSRAMAAFPWATRRGAQRRRRLAR